MDDLTNIIDFCNNSLESGGIPSTDDRRVTSRILSKLHPNKEPGRHPVPSNSRVDL